jgi:hypothetical protein
MQFTRPSVDMRDLRSADVQCCTDSDIHMQVVVVL